MGLDLKGFDGDVIVIAGTYDARVMINKLCESNIKVVATVTTSYGKHLIEDGLDNYDCNIGRANNIEVFEKALSIEEMEDFIKRVKPKCLIDASHPYAQLVSQNAIEICKKTNTKYMRFERESTGFFDERIIYVRDYEEAADVANSLEGNILLTTGSKTLDIFFRRGTEFMKRLFVRVLPDSKVLVKCEDAGLPKGNIIAMKGPFSEEFNMDTIKHINAKVLVTKDSGEVGGTLEKVNAGLKLGIKIIMIERPKVEGLLDFNVENRLDNIDEVIQWAISCVGEGKK